MSHVSGENYVDLSRIDPLLIKNNYIFAPGFNGKYVVLRATVVPERLTIWDYDPIVEGLISGPVAAATSTNGVSNHTYVTPQRPKSTQIPSLPQFIFQNEKKSDRMYQIFFGISSSDLDVLFNQPASTNQITLPVQQPDETYNQYGYILGKDNEIDSPGPDSQIWVPPGIDFAIGFRNANNQSYKPLIRWFINYFEYEIVKDANLIFDVLNTTKYRALKTVGGVEGLSYNVEANIGAPAFNLGTPLSTIQDVVSTL